MSAALTSPRPAALAATAAGCVALVARPVLLRVGPDPTVALVLLFLTLLLAGVCIPVRADRGRAPACSPVVAVAVGTAAFALGRLLAGGHQPAPVTVELVALNTLAAVGEEAFFRRLVFDALRPGGVAAAVAGSALLFAVVHVTVYGAWVLPIDLAAGLVLSWQRWATGSWVAPAVTHVLANVLVVI